MLIVGLYLAVQTIRTFQEDIDMKMAEYSHRMYHNTPRLPLTIQQSLSKKQRFVQLNTGITCAMFLGPLYGLSAVIGRFVRSGSVLRLARPP